VKVLITGGAGFIGSHLAEYFQNSGDEETVLDNFSTG
jgi:UDP-glucose 4-epimerase